MRRRGEARHCAGQKWCMHCAGSRGRVLATLRGVSQHPSRDPDWGVRTVDRTAPASVSNANHFACRAMFSVGLPLLAFPTLTLAFQASALQRGAPIRAHSTSVVCNGQRRQREEGAGRGGPEAGGRGDRQHRRPGDRHRLRSDGVPAPTHRLEEGDMGTPKRKKAPRWSIPGAPDHFRHVGA